MKLRNVVQGMYHHREIGNGHNRPELFRHFADATVLPSNTIEQVCLCRSAVMACDSVKTIPRESTERVDDASLIRRPSPESSDMANNPAGVPTPAQMAALSAAAGQAVNVPVQPPAAEQVNMWAQLVSDCTYLLWSTVLTHAPGSNDLEDRPSTHPRKRLRVMEPCSCPITSPSAQASSTRSRSRRS